MKKCTRCKTLKPLEDFNKMTKAKDGSGRQDRCRECCKEWYKNNSEKHKANVAKRNEKIRIELRQQIITYLSEHKCTDCGEDDLIVLEFDHTTNNKLYNISTMMQMLYSWETIRKEIEKCEVVCANCHKRRTAKRAKTYRYLFLRNQRLKKCLQR